MKKNKNTIIYGAAGSGKTSKYLIPAIEEFNGNAIGISIKDERNLFNKPQYIRFLDINTLDLDIITLGNQDDIFKDDNKVFIPTGFEDPRAVMKILNDISLQHDKDVLVAIDEFISYNFENHIDVLLRLLENNSVNVIMCIKSLDAFKIKYKDMLDQIMNSCQFISSKKLIEYSGDVRLRIPKSLHRELSIKAELEGISLNQYIVYLLSKGIGLSKKELWVNKFNETFLSKINRNNKKNKSKVENNDNMKMIEISDGYVVVPDDWIILDESTSKRKCYVGVVEIKNGYKYDAPHFLFFSDVPISELSENDINIIDDKCCKKWGKYKQVLSDYVKPEYDKDRNIINIKEYSECPIPGYFNIPDSDELYSDFPCGAKVYRKL